MKWSLHILETPEECQTVEALQRLVWPGSETDIVPGHLLRAAIHGGGLAIGAYSEEGDVSQGKPALVGFVFGFPGFYSTPDGPRLKHCSHMLGVHPQFRNQGMGFALKRAQWQMVRRQGIDRIVWTYDPLLSANAHLNINRLGAVCNTYLRDFYGEMQDGLNWGLSSDRFYVDWWVNSRRVDHRLSRQARPALDLAHYLRAGTPLLQPILAEKGNTPSPQGEFEALLQRKEALILVEIPVDFLALKAADLPLAQAWRTQSRAIFEVLFTAGYLVTDFVHQASETRRSFYVLSHGESTL